jgi:hypothetical protein
MEEDFTIRQRDIKVRKKWPGDMKPVTKVLPKKRSKREKDNVRKRIHEELDDFVSEQ